VLCEADWISMVSKHLYGVTGHVCNQVPQMDTRPRQDFGEWEDNWDGNNTLTYLQLANNASYEVANCLQQPIAQRKEVSQQAGDRPEDWRHSPVFP